MAQFIVHKSTPQTTTDQVDTAVTWDTEDIDASPSRGSFASDGWTPPAGIVLIGCNLEVTSSAIAVSAACNLKLFKDGTEVARVHVKSYLNFCGPQSFVYLDEASGTNVYTIQSFLDTNGVAPSIDSTSTTTRFWGQWLGTSASQTAAFKADKNGSDQTGMSQNTFTDVTFGTERFDYGSKFASDTWTPPSGVILMTASVGNLGTIAVGTDAEAAITKNGTRIARSAHNCYTNDGTAYIALLDTCNGTDTYKLQGLNPGTASRTFSGLASYTHFAGIWLSA